ncbi:hypothetical protein IHE44_0007981 [Lamprotornis superbus]|uniref:DIX domain-containing protein n=1 Tax=Lamprotornis superbus TaxID=245042 RepID=A0A835TMS2_9PASS|nr:hypothetical protein IHE44_0007981 [Lamprotornis superbus]
MNVWLAGGWKGLMDCARARVAADCTNPAQGWQHLEQRNKGGVEKAGKRNPVGTSVESDAGDEIVAQDKVVKEEISDDNAKLPCFNGRVVSWLVLAESCHSDTASQGTESHPELPPALERTGGIGDSRPPSFQQEHVTNITCFLNLGLCLQQLDRHREHPPGYDSSSTMMSSELESSSFIDSEDDDNTSRLSSSTEQSTSSRLIRKHKRRRRKQRMRQIDRSSSFSSITDSTMSLNIITVTLNMEKYNFLGISIVNDVNFENMSNDDAVRVLREIVSKPGPISLTVAKCWDPTPRSYFTIPRGEYTFGLFAEFLGSPQGLEYFHLFLHLTNSIHSVLSFVYFCIGSLGFQDTFSEIPLPIEFLGVFSLSSHLWIKLLTFWEVILTFQFRKVGRKDVCRCDKHSCLLLVRAVLVLLEPVCSSLCTENESGIEDEGGINAIDWCRLWELP